MPRGWVGVPVRGYRGESTRASLGQGGPPHHSARLRAAPRQQLGTERLLRAPWAGAKWEEVRGGQGGGEDGEGLSETKEFLKIRGEMRRGTREEPAGWGLCSFAWGLGWRWSPQIIFVEQTASSPLCRGKALRNPRASLLPSFLTKKRTNKQTTGAFHVKSEKKAPAGPVLGSRTIKP